MAAPFAPLAALLAIAVIGFLSERTWLGRQLTGTVVVLSLAILASNTGVIPHTAPAYDFVFSYLVPVIIPLFLLRADIRAIWASSARLTIAFLLASTATVAGVTVAMWTLDLQDLAAYTALDRSQIEPALAGLFSATYIGGSVNYAALGEVTGLSSARSLFSAATAVDNVFSSLYLAALALLSGSGWLTRRFARLDSGQLGEESSTQTSVSPLSIALALGTAVGVVALSDQLVSSFDMPGLRYVWITVLTVALATLVPNLSGRLAGGFEIGVVLSFVFFAAIAAGANIPAVLELAPALIGVAALLLSIHLIILLIVGRGLGLSLPELITASNAAILGATTAPALAATRGWHRLVTPGVLVGVLGYALGTLVGTAIYRWGHYWL